MGCITIPNFTSASPMAEDHNSDNNPWLTICGNSGFPDLANQAVFNGAAGIDYDWLLKKFHTLEIRIDELSGGLDNVSRPRKTRVKEH